MPHIPKSATPGLSSTTGPPSELMFGDDDETKRRKLPPARSPQQQAQQRETFGLPTISITRYQVSPDRVFEQLFGKALSVHDITGVSNMVS